MYRETLQQELKSSYPRTIYLDRLIKNHKDIKQNRGKNLILLGQKNIGKTHLLKSLIALNDDQLICLFDLTKNALTPENFAISMIFNIASWHLKADTSHLDKCNFGTKTSKIVAVVKNELLKIKPDHNLLLGSAFAFPEAIGEDKDLEITICLDEFHRLLDLNNFDKIKDVINFFQKSILSHKRTKYILCSSSIWLTYEINKKLNYEIIKLPLLNLHEIGNDEIHYYSGGIPAYACAIKSNKSNPKFAFLQETLWTQGKIYLCCKLILVESLSAARGKGLLLAILETIANRPLRLSEIGRNIYRSAAVTKNLINRLIEVDLISREGNLFSFNDPILRFWFTKYSKSIEFENIPRKNQIDKIKVDL